MIAMTVDIGTLIVRSPEIRGGEPRIAGTGVTVKRIVGWYKLGFSPEEIADKFGHLSLAQVYAACGFTVYLFIFVILISRYVAQLRQAWLARF